MNRWKWLLVFPYVVSVVPKEGRCIRWNDSSSICQEREASGEEAYLVGGLEVKDRELALDIAQALNKAHESREASSTRGLQESDEPTLRDSSTGKSPS